MTSAKRCMETTSANTSCVTVTSPSVSGCDLSRIAKRFVDPTKIASIGHEWRGIRHRLIHMLTHCLIEAFNITNKNYLTS